MRVLAVQLCPDPSEGLWIIGQADASAVVGELGSRHFRVLFHNTVTPALPFRPMIEPPGASDEENAAAERKAKHRSQSDEIYAAIGRFSVKFEQLLEALRMGLIFTLHRQGLANQRVIRALLSRLTAAPLRETWGAVLTESYTARPDPAETEKVRRFLVRTLEEITLQRNTIIHSTWYVGWASPEDEDFSVVSGADFNRTARGGVTFKSLDWTAADFDRETARVLEAIKMVNAFTTLLQLDLPLAQRFVVEADQVTYLGDGRA